MALSKAVIFDFGGVIVAPTEDIMYTEAGRLFGRAPEEMQMAMEAHIPAFQQGQINEAGFWEAVQRDIGEKRETLGFLRAVFEANLHVYDDVVAYIRTVLQRQGIITALLTNTMESHAAVNRAHHLYDPFNPAILSNEVRMRKPDREIYEYMLKQLGLPGEQCIYVDDLPENLVPAKKLGMDTIHCTGPEQMLEELNSKLEIRNSKQI